MKRIHILRLFQIDMMSKTRALKIRTMVKTLAPRRYRFEAELRRVDGAPALPLLHLLPEVRDGPLEPDAACR